MLKQLYRKKIGLSVCLLFFVGVLLFKDCLLARVLEIHLSNALKKEGWSALQTEVKKNRILIQGLEKPGIFIEKADISSHFSLLPFVFVPEITLSGVTLSLEEENVMNKSYLNKLGFLIGNSFFRPKLRIKEGEILSPSSDTFFSFWFDPSPEERKIGSLYIEEKGEEKPFLIAGFAKEDKGVLATLEILEGKLFFLLPWVSSFTQNFGGKKWDTLEGKISAYIQCCLDKKEGVNSLQADMAFEGLNLESLSSQYKLKAKSLQGTLSFSKKEPLPIWQQADLFLTFEDLFWLKKSEEQTFGLEGALGEIRLHPKEDPYLKAGGTLRAKGHVLPFEIEGTYETLDKGAYFLQTNLFFFLPHSQPTIHASFCQNEEGEGLLEARWEQLGKELSDLYEEASFFLKTPVYLIEKGSIDGHLLARFDKNLLKTAEFSDLRAKNLIFHIPSQEFSFVAQSLTLQGVVAEGKITSLEAEVKRASLSLGEIKVEDVAAKIEIIEGEFAPSYVEGSYFGSKIAAQLLFSSSAPLLHIEWGLSNEELKRLFSFKEEGILEGKDPIFVALDLYPQEGESRFFGTVRFPCLGREPQDMEIEGRLDKIVTRKVSDLFSDWNLSSAEGTFVLQGLSGKTIAPYFKKFFSDFSIQGSCDLSGFFNSKRIGANLTCLDLSMERGLYKVMGQIGNKEPISLIYHKEENRFDTRALVDTLFIEDQSRNLKVEIQDTLFIGKDTSFISDEWRALFEGVELLGSFTYDGNGIEMALKSVDIDIKKVTPLFSKYFSNSFFLPLEGVFSLPEKGCLASLKRKEEGWDLSWTLVGKLFDLSCSLGDFGLFKEGEGILSTDSLGRFSLKQLKGCYALGSFSSNLIFEDFHWTPGKKVDFKMRADQSGIPSGLISGCFIPQGEGITLNLNKGSHILGLEVACEPILFEKGGIASLIKGSFSYKWEQISSYLTLFKQMGFSFPYPSVPLIEGKAKIEVTYDRKTDKTLFHITTPEFFHEKNPIGKLSCDVYHKQGLWSVDSCIVGPYSFSGKMKKKENKWLLEGCCFTFLEGKLLAEGLYDPGACLISLPSIFLSWEKGDEQAEIKASFNGTFSSDFTLQGKGGLEKVLLRQGPYIYAVKKGTFFTLSPGKGIFTEKSRWDCIDYKEKELLAKVAVENLTYLFPEKKLLVRGASVRIGKKGIFFIQDNLLCKDFMEIGTDKEVLLEIDGQVSPGYKQGSVTLKNGSLKISGLSIEIKNIQLLEEKDKLYLSCETLWEKQPVLMRWQSRVGDLSFFGLTIKEDSKDPGLSLVGERKGQKPWSVSTIEGSFGGLDLKMEKVAPLDKKSLCYNTRLRVDLLKLSSFLPQKTMEVIQKWGLGKGYGYTGVIGIDEGSFHLNSLQGVVNGEDFTCFGKTLHSLKAKVLFAKRTLFFQDLTVEDPVGFLTIKTLEAKLESESGHWLLSAPLVHIKDFSPSLFTKGKEGGAIIKNMSLRQVKGFLQDIDSFEGTGALNFVRPIKKEFSFWDIPLNLIKDFGLDTGLLTPVIGEAEFILTRGRLYFTALKNMYSEAERSQFNLASPIADSYLGLDGTCHIDLKMKQNVVLKVTEDLVLSIRGTIEKPKYSFKWRDNRS